MIKKHVSLNKSIILIMTVLLCTNLFGLNIFKVNASPNDEQNNNEELNLDVTELENQIYIAEAKVNGIVVGDSPGEYPEESYNIFIDLIEDAKDILENSDVTEDDIEKMIEALEMARLDFQNAHNLYGSLSIPIIHLTNFNITSGSKNDLLNPESIFDFSPSGDLKDEEVYIEYHYDDIVE